MTWLKGLILRSREVFTHDESIDELLYLFLEEASYKLNTGEEKRRFETNNNQVPSKRLVCSEVGQVNERSTRMVQYL